MREPREPTPLFGHVGDFSRFGRYTAMREPTPLSVLAGERVDVIYVTGALRDGHWLRHQERGGCVLLFVADDLADEAKGLWWYASVLEPTGVR